LKRMLWHTKGMQEKLQVFCYSMFHYDYHLIVHLTFKSPVVEQVGVPAYH